MANVEIYKLKKTVDPEVRNYGMFEFFGLVNGPLPQNYVREWAGELPSGDLATILGRSEIDPPDGYHGGLLVNGDIVVVDGQAYFLDQAPSYHFAEVDLDTAAIKDAIHVEYGKYVSMDGAVSIPRTLAAVCENLGIPIGYLGEPGHHGSDKGISSFDQTAFNDYATCYLHPEFLKGDEARAFAGLLEELSQTDHWDKIAAYLLQNYPVYMSDLEAARERLAPELLLPDELRRYSKVIPVGTDTAEVSYLAAKVRDMREDDKAIFDVIINMGQHCESVAEIINLTENLDCFHLRADTNTAEYGSFVIKNERFALENDFKELESLGLKLILTTRIMAAKWLRLKTGTLRTVDT